VPSTRNPKEYGDYALSIYVNKGLDDFELTRIDRKEECKIKFITYLYILVYLIAEE